MRYSNLHTHTTFSDGAHSPEENVKSALEKNMISIGFSDHSYTYEDSSYCMKKSSYPEYLKQIRELKEKYKDSIKIFSGLELDYYSGTDHISDFDYVIASVHYIIKDGICYPIDHTPEQQKTCIQNAFDGDIYAMVQCYFDLLCEHVERCNPALVGHFDVITKFSLMPEDDERYRQIAAHALKRIIRTCPYIEVNTGAVSRGWRTEPYPSHYLFRTILEAGGKLVLSSDSHNRDNLIYAFDETVEMLKRIGFDRIYAFNGTGFEPNLI